MSNPVALKPNKAVPAIPQPAGDPASLANVLTFVKQGLQSLAGHTGRPTARAVTFDDLADLGLVSVTNGLAKGSAGTTVVNNITEETASSGGSSGSGGSGGSGSSTAAPAQTLMFPPIGPALIGRTSWNRPAASALTTLNMASNVALVDIANGPLTLFETATGGGDNLRFAGQAPPPAPWTYTVLASEQTFPEGYNFFGPIALTNAAGALVVIHLETARDIFGVESWNSPTSFNEGFYNTSYSKALDKTAWFRLVNDGTTLTWQFSVDGNVFTNIVQTSLGGSIGTISSVGFVIDAVAASAGRVVGGVIYHAAFS